MTLLSSRGLYLVGAPAQIDARRILPESIVNSWDVPLNQHPPFLVVLIDQLLPTRIIDESSGPDPIAKHYNYARQLLLCLSPTIAGDQMGPTVNPIKS